MKDLGIVDVILCVKVIKPSGGIILTQTSYIKSFLKI